MVKVLVESASVSKYKCWAKKQKTKTFHEPLLEAKNLMGFFGMCLCSLITDHDLLHLG